MNHYRLLLQYRGTRYAGWQVQPDQPTIQGEINLALERISKGKVQSLGAGRTDAGVHALGQVAKVSMELSLQPEQLQRALNAHLPSDIRVLRVEICLDDFHPTVDAVWKEYHYRFTNVAECSAFQTELIANYSFPLDLAPMQAACRILIGEHDFTNFYCEGTEVRSYVRKIFDCSLREVPAGEWEMLPGHYLFSIRGNGFLKQMVRQLVGAIWSIGRGKVSLEQFQSALSPQKVQRLGVTAPPEGLYMHSVGY